MFIIQDVKILIIKTRENIHWGPFEMELDDIKTSHKLTVRAKPTEQK